MTGKDIFKYDTIAVTGDFGPNRTSDKMKSWIQHHAGRFAHEVSSSVTHLISSKQHFKREVTMVRQARQYKHIKIVSFDWLEDSLLSTPQKRQPEKAYLLNTLVEVKAAKKTRKKAVRKQNIEQSIKNFDKSCQDFEKDMFSDGYHIYRDHTTFAYDITLARVDLTTNKNQRYSLKVNSPPLARDEYIRPPSPTTSCSSTLTNPYASPSQTLDGRLDHLDDLFSLIDEYLPSFISPRPAPPIFPSYLPSQLHPSSPSCPCPPIRAYIRHPRAQRLQLYESHTTPKRFACYVKYSAFHEPTTPEMVAPINSSFDVAFGAFKQFFALKVGTDWDERLVGCGGGRPRVGAAAGTGEGFFYSPPKEGSQGIVKGHSAVERVEAGHGAVVDGVAAEERGGQGGGGGGGAGSVGEGALAGDGGLNGEKLEKGGGGVMEVTL